MDEDFKKKLGGTNMLNYLNELGKLSEGIGSRSERSLDRIWRKESRINAILKPMGYKWLKNYSDLKEKERDRLLSIKKFDLQTAHAYHFRIAMLRIRKVNVTIAESYLKKWISWASRSRMPDIVKLGKTIMRHLDGILEAIRSA